MAGRWTRNYEGSYELRLDDNHILTTCKVRMPHRQDGLVVEGWPGGSTYYVFDIQEGESSRAALYNPQADDRALRFNPPDSDPAMTADFLDFERHLTETPGLPETERVGALLLLDAIKQEPDLEHRTE